MRTSDYNSTIKLNKSSKYVHNHYDEESTLKTKRKKADHV